VAKELARVNSEPERYARLAPRVWEEVRHYPAEAARRRLQAGLKFLFGAAWFGPDHRLAEEDPGQPMPGWLRQWYPFALQGTLLALFLLAALGWRWAYGWRLESMPASLAVVWIPLPYLLSHAESLSGPRLPLDGVLLCYAAFALACLVPGVGRRLLDGAQSAEPDRDRV